MAGSIVTGSRTFSMASGRFPFSSPVTFLLLLTTVVAYRSSFYTEWVFDDVPLIAVNPGLTDLDEVWTHIGLESDRPPTHRIVRTLSYMLDLQVWGRNPVGMHVTNLLIHLANVLLAAALVLRLGLVPWAAFFAALLFAVHPVQVDSVTYLSGRRDVLAAFFYLAALVLHLDRRDEPAGAGWKVALIALFLLGLFTKEHVATLPGVLVLIEIHLALRGRARPAADPERVGEIIRRIVSNLRRHAGLLMILFLIAGLFTIYIVRFQPHNIHSFYPQAIRMPTNLPTLARVYAHYMGLWVHPRHLSIDYYPVSIPPADSWDRSSMLCGALVVVILVSSFGAFLRGRLWGLGGVLAMAFFLPMSNLLFSFNEPVAEHYLYLPTLGATLALTGWLAARWPPDRSTLPHRWIALLGILAVLHALRTDRRNRDWLDPVSVYGSTLAAYPDNSRVLHNLGSYLALKGHFEEAHRLLERALEIHPNQCAYKLSIADIYRREERVGEALAAYDRVIETCPGYRDPVLGKAGLLIGIGRHEDAAATLDQARPRALQHRDWELFQWLGVALREAGRLVEAEAAFRTALGFAPQAPSLLWHQAQLLHRMDRTDEALEVIALALRLVPDSGRMQETRGRILETRGTFETALEAYRKMEEVNPDLAVPAWIHQARVLAGLGRTGEAEDLRRRAQEATRE